MPIDEGPSSEDLDRFGADGMPCPNCGEEIHPDVPQCPHCRQWITTRRSVAGWRMRRWQGWLVLVLAGLVIAGLVLRYVI